MKLSKDSNVLILSHFSERSLSSGYPPEVVRDFFLKKVKSIIYIEHPFPYSHDHRSSMITYEKGKLKHILFTPSVIGPQFFFYIADIFITWYFLLRARRQFNLCVALDNLNVISVLPFRKMDLIKKLVFYTIDYSPVRFKNKFLNWAYHLADRIAGYNADVIWVLSERVIEARIKNGVNHKKSAPTILLPMGAKLDRIKVLPVSKIFRYQVVYIGHLLKRQGVQLVLQALKDIIKQIPKVKFIIIGQGEYELALKKLTQRLKLSNHVEFKGFVENDLKVEKILCQSSIGVAPYGQSEENYTFYGDPGKPKLYLGCGLPVVITNVPTIAQIINKSKAGFVVDYNIKSMKNALITLLANDALYKQYRENAVKLSKNYNTTSLIEKALAQTYHA